MINKYRRAARTAEELGLGELARLDRASPELRAEDDEGDDGDKVDGADEVSTGSVYQEAADSTSSGSGAWIRTMIRGFKDLAPRSPVSDPLDLKEIRDVEGDTSPPFAPAVAASPAPVSATSTAIVTPRARLLAALLEGARAAVEAGDIAAARVAHEAAGRLLGNDAPPFR